MTKVEFEINGKKLTIKSKWVGERTGFPFDDKDTLEHNIFNITISRKVDSKTVRRQFKFYDSYQNYLDGKRELSKEDTLFAFRCIIEDAIYGSYDFDDFCGELGYSNDSIRALKMYKACKRTLNKLMDLGIYESELYDIVNKLSEEGIE